MCGVLGLVYENHHPQLGRIAAELLKTLEYRGYDSTGAAIQRATESGSEPDVRLAKGVGAPSVMVHELGIVEMAGQVFCGQVRWATFGAVTESNSQPHVVRCKTFLYGAHNGNVTNCDDLKAWLLSEGHGVVSDNDGEMVVHTIEHFFARELAKLTPAATADAGERRRCMRAALLLAAAKLQGSYAAVVVDPQTRTAWAVKQGSSLYFGLGTDAVGGRFAIASSDLSAVLKLTRVLLPLQEGEFVEYTPQEQRVYAVRDRRLKTVEGDRLVRAGEPIARGPVRSRLRAKDTALLPDFKTFMDQEISAQGQTVRNLVTLLLGGTSATRLLGPYMDALSESQRHAIGEALDGLRDLYEDRLIRERFHALVDLPAFRALLSSVPADLRQRGTMGTVGEVADKLASTEAGFLADLLPMARDTDDRLAVRLLDVLLEQAEVIEFGRAVRRFTELCAEAIAAGGRLFVVCCGSSYHAAKAAALFFNEMAGVQLLPVLPGEFRGQYRRSLRDGDLFIAVSQSGETKDLIDVLNHVVATGKKIARVGVVNNLNSTLAQEKSDLVIPLRCGPEIAVPATKSFLNQVTIFYCLALRLGQHLCAAGPAAQRELLPMLQEREDKLLSLPALIRETFDSTDGAIEQAAQALFLCPSLHLLATRITAVALEGALKIREVVLNHTEGYEGSEFKHGPNTILGFNTLFGPLQVDALLRRIGAIGGRLTEEAGRRGLPAERAGRLVQALLDSVFSPGAAGLALHPVEQELLDGAFNRSELVDLLYADYPLVYITGPDEQDINLTVSQINTHKIRGASSIVVAEESLALHQAASKAPTDNPAYRWVYITLPRTGDTLMTVFSATVVLQRLALKMSLLKMHYLDRLGIADHGVHPDVPKNVSKSITVD